jgi:VIT1/CCC1 family predicted Fe2+/Mn2+ transporter
MNPRTDLWQQNLVDERDGAALYEGLARHEKDPSRAKSFRELGEAERRHAEVWQRKLEKEGVAVPPDEPSARVKALLWLARRLGSAAVVPLALEAEAIDADKYEQQGEEAAAIAVEEREHRAVLSDMTGRAPDTARGLISSRERWHRGGGRAGSIRAAIFGMNDGLLSNLSLILGVAGAGVAPESVVITGFAGLLAGAFSMAAGEYTSVASQRDLLTRQVALEKREIEEAPEEEAAELALIFKQKGLSTEQASRTAGEILKHPDSALDTLVREELGLDPEDLGSPVGAALSSFVMFAVGAIVPVVPYLLLKGQAAAVVSASLAGVVLAAVGGLVGFLSGTGIFRSAARMVGLAALAAGVTYLVGRAFGAAVG